MPTSIPTPYFAQPPREYNQQYMADLVRAFAQYVAQDRNPGQGRFTFAVFTDLHDGDDVGLAEGTVFVREGVLTVASLTQAYPAGSKTLTASGDVSVLIT